VYRLLHYVKQKFGHYLLSERTLALIYATIQSIYYARTENWSRAASVIMSITDSVERDYGEPTLILSPWYNVQGMFVNQFRAVVPRLSQRPYLRSGSSNYARTSSEKT
jgi:hypothetical protein